jgi:hypothetical protein
MIVSSEIIRPGVAPSYIPFAQGAWIQRDFGAKGDGETDDTAAFINAREAIKAAARTNFAPYADPTKIGGMKLYLEAGSYLITSPEALMDGEFNTPVFGYGLQGMGEGITQIIYAPETSGPLINFNDSFLAIRIKDVRFDGADDASDFWVSTSSGKTQDVFFENVTWTGRWKNGTRLEGTNTNSEFGWLKCIIDAQGFAGPFLRSNGSDQFLNYWFDMCKYVSGTKPWASMVKGGHVKIHNCDASNWGADLTEDVYLFELLGTGHAFGVQDFEARGLRVEHKSEHACLLRTDWQFGNIAFDGYDGSSNVFAVGSGVYIDTHFYNAPGASIKFSNAYIPGTMRVSFLQDNYSQRGTISFESCTFHHCFGPDDFVEYALESAPEGSISYGSAPWVLFSDDCKGVSPEGYDSQDTVFWGCNLSAIKEYASGGRGCHNGALRRRTISLKTSQCQTPFNGANARVHLPVGAVVLGLYALFKAGDVSSGATYTFTAIAGITTIASLSSPGAANAGFRVKREFGDDLLPYRCDNSADATITVAAGSEVNEPGYKSLVLLDYLA